MEPIHTAAMRRMSMSVACLFLAAACSDRNSSSGDKFPSDASAAGAGTLPSDHGLAFVINTKDPSLTVVERSTQAVVRTIEFPEHVGVEAGHFGALTKDGQTLWLCSDLQNKTVQQGTMEVYETEQFTRIASFDVGCGVQSSLSRDGRYLFASSTKTNAIEVFDVASVAHIGRFDVASAPHVGDFSPDGTTYYTSNANGGRVLGFDTTVLPLNLPLPLVYDQALGPFMLHGIRMHPSGRYLFVGGGGFTRIIELAGQSVLFEFAGHPHNLALSPDGNTLAIGDPNAQKLSLLNIATLNELTPSPTQITEFATIMTPNYGVNHQSWDERTGKLWVTLGRTIPDDGRGQLWIVNTQVTPPVVEKSIQIGDGPHGILFAGRKCE
ncbi:MAG TPA: hypothetical protein VIV60_01700 [Polyangiaceae bacterium]